MFPCASVKGVPDRYPGHAEAPGGVRPGPGGLGRILHPMPRVAARQIGDINVSARHTPSSRHSELDDRR